MLVIPAGEFREWIARYPQLQEFLNAMLSERLAETMMVVEEVAFRRVDLRHHLPEPLPDRSALSSRWRSSRICQSGPVAPSPRPSGSSLLTTEVTRQRGAASQASRTWTEIATGTIA